MQSRNQVPPTGGNTAHSQSLRNMAKALAEPDASVVPNPPHTILRLKQVQARTGLSRSSIYAKMALSGKYYDASFPRRVKLGPKAIGWYETAINHWLATRTCGNAIVN